MKFKYVDYAIVQRRQSRMIARILRAIIIGRDARNANVQAALNESAFKIVIPRAIKRICKLYNNA